MKVDGEELRITPAIAEFGAGREAALGVVFRTEGKIGAAVDDPVDLLPEDQSLGRGVSKGRDQKSRLPALGINPMGHVGREKEGYAQQRKPGISRLRFAVRNIDLGGK